MSVECAALYRPTRFSSPNFPTKFRSPAPISYHIYSHSKSLLSCDNLFRRSGGALAIDGRQGLRPAASSWRTGDDDGDDGEKEGEGATVLEKGPLIDWSSSLSMSNLFSGGLEPTVNRLSKWLVSGALGLIILWRHDGEALWAVIGSVLNAMLSVILKRILNQERPASNGKSDPGMPSSHAQSIFFGAALAIVTMIEGQGFNELTLILSGLTLSIGSYLSWLRVSQQYHTANQVVVGAALGLSFALVWFWSWNTVVSEEFDSFLWVQVSVLLGAAACALGFLLYIVRTWFIDEQ